ncbi:hypothetical protein MKX03_013894, partial [Papaver bracteatum]
VLLNLPWKTQQHHLVGIVKLGLQYGITLLGKSHHQNMLCVGIVTQDSLLIL